MRETSHFAHRAKDADGAGGRRTRADREECYRCGRGVPKRLRGTGYCSNKCHDAQLLDDMESADTERRIQEHGGME